MAIPSHYLTERSSSVSEKLENVKAEDHKIRKYLPLFFLRFQDLWTEVRTCLYRGKKVCLYRQMCFGKKEIGSWKRNRNVKERHVGLSLLQGEKMELYQVLGPKHFTCPWFRQTTTKATTTKRLFFNCIPCIVHCLTRSKSQTTAANEQVKKKKRSKICGTGTQRWH